MELLDGLADSITTGQAASEHVHGMSQFDYFAQHPQAAEIFDQAMTNLATQWHAAALTAYDFSRARTVVDIGGRPRRAAYRYSRRPPSAPGRAF